MRLNKYSAMACAAVMCLLVSTATVSAADTYYRWTDAQGTTQLSDRPPPAGIDYELVSSKTRQVPQNPGGTAPPEPRDGTPSSSGPVPAAQMEKNPEQCKLAQENLVVLERGGRIRLRDDEGELRFMSVEEIEEQMQRARDVIDAHCE